MYKARVHSASETGWEPLCLSSKHTARSENAARSSVIYQHCSIVVDYKYYTLIFMNCNSYNYTL